MFLTNQYIFSDEYIDKTKMHRANISMARNTAEAKDCFDTIKKMGRYSFIDVNSPLLPAYVTKHIKHHNFTNMENLLPLSYVKKEFKVSDEDLDRLINQTAEFKGYKNLAGTQFVEFDQEFVSSLKYCVPYVLTKKDLDSCINSHVIDGYITLNKNSYLAWYGDETSI